MKYDVIIVGSGAGGGTLARRLSAHGRSVLVLERGGWLPREAENWDPREVFGQGRYLADETWADAVGNKFRPQQHYNVGGSTKFYGACLMRMRPSDFAFSTAHASNQVSIGWPVSYDEMERWYTLGERMYDVHGMHGIDPTEGPFTERYPRPPVSHEPRIAWLSQALSDQGLHPFHAPMAVDLDETDELASPCIRCKTCDGFPCLVRAKNDAETRGIVPALQSGYTQILAGALVTGLRVSADGRKVDGVMATVRGQTSLYEADTVVLSAGAINTARLLLTTQLANSSGLVGANYMCHTSQAVMSVWDEPNPTRFQKTLAWNDWYDGTASMSLKLGGVQMLGKSTPGLVRGESHISDLIAHMPGGGPTLTWITDHAIDLWLTTEDCASPANRVEVTGSGQVTLRYKTDHYQANQLYALTRHALLKAGAGYVTRKFMPLAATAHQMGTARMGNDPASSVVDANLRCHDLDNLYICDASVFPSSGAVNPALTVIALALRLGDYLGSP